MVGNDLSPEEMEAQEQIELESGPLSLLTNSVKNNTQVRVEENKDECFWGKGRLTH